MRHFNLIISILIVCVAGTWGCVRAFSVFTSIAYDRPQISFNLVSDGIVGALMVFVAIAIIISLFRSRRDFQPKTVNTNGNHQSKYVKVFKIIIFLLFGLLALLLITGRLGIPIFGQFTVPALFTTVISIIVLGIIASAIRGGTDEYL